MQKGVVIIIKGDEEDVLTTIKNELRFGTAITGMYSVGQLDIQTITIPDKLLDNVLSLIEPLET